MNEKSTRDPDLRGPVAQWVSKLLQSFFSGLKAIFEFELGRPPARISIGDFRGDMALRARSVGNTLGFLCKSSGWQ